MSFAARWTPPPKMRDLEPPPAPTVRPIARGVYAPVGVSAAVPKAEKAKPGKRAPNVAERAWMDWIVARGCIACQRDGLGHRAAAVHHILRGGRRMGHLYTLPLCDPGHHQGGQPLGMAFDRDEKREASMMVGERLDPIAALNASIAGVEAPADAPPALENSPWSRINGLPCPSLCKASCAPSKPG